MKKNICEWMERLVQKTNRKYVMFILFLLLASLVEAQYIYKAPDINSLRGKNIQRIEKLKKELADLRQLLIQRNNKFVIGQTKVFHLQVNQVAGFKTGYINPQSGGVSSYTEPSLCDPRQVKWDWRDRQIQPIVREQGECGACWAFSVITVLEANYLLQYRSKQNLSPQFLINCVDDGCEGGFAGNGYAFSTKNGIPLEFDFPYRGKTMSCLLQQKGKYLTARFGWVNEKKPVKPSVAQIKQALCRYGPLSTSILATRPFLAYKGGIFDEKERGETNHALVIMGWDERKRAWLVQNSWGKDWGQGGYGWVQYDSNQIGAYSQWARIKNNE